MPDFKISYATATDATITLASLATDINLLSGRESTAIDNTTARNLDILISGKITTGTNPVASRSIEIWATGSWDGTNWSSPFVGSGDSNRSLTNSASKALICRLVSCINTDATSNRTYSFGPVSVASIFGGVLPPRMVLFVTHNTGGVLNSTSNNHLIRLQPVYQTVN